MEPPSDLAKAVEEEQGHSVQVLLFDQHTLGNTAPAGSQPTP